MNTPPAPHTHRWPAARRRRALGFLAAGAAAGVLGAALSWWRTSPSAEAAGAVQAFWGQQMRGLDGQTWQMAAWRGQPLLLNFWATWCPPCVHELPMMDAFYRENAAKGLQMLALALDKPESVRAFVARQGLTLPVAVAQMDGFALAKSLGNTAGGLPFSVFFDANGRIYTVKSGQLSQDDLDVWWDKAR